MKSKLVAYLNFDGNATEALKYYQSILGGKLFIQTFGEAFGEAAGEHKDRLMHGHLEGDWFELMASDTSPEHSPPFVQGNNVHLSLVGTDEEKLRSCFAKLSEGGRVDMPLEKQFWGDIFGMLTDKFGVHWMVNVSRG